MSVNATTINALNRLQSYSQADVLRRAGEKYGFDATEAITELVVADVEIVPDTAAPKKAKKAVDKSDGEEVTDEPKTEKPPKFVSPAFALPWTGVVVVGCCKGIRDNYRTFTQCTMPPRKDTEFCNTCSKDGGPKSGTISNRGDTDWRDPDKGLAPKHYSNYIKSKKLDPQSVVDEAAKFGITISLPDLAPPIKPSKSVASTHDSDDDDDPKLPMTQHHDTHDQSYTMSPTSPIEP
jgi:hypothetical protein